MKKNKISIFVPIYNEERVIANHISKILNTMNNINKVFEIIIVDDNSSDNSQKICENIASKNKKIRYIRYNTGPSRRENLSLSFKKASGDIIAYMDADLSVDLFYVKRLFDEIERGADISIGSRYIKGSYAKRTFSRRIISYIYNAFLRYFLNSKIHDHQCGFKAFKKYVLLDLIKDSGYDAKFIRGWFWDAEILIRAQKKSYKIVEFPIKWHYGKNSTFDLKRELRMVWYILRNRKSFYV